MLSNTKSSSVKENISHEKSHGSLRQKEKTMESLRFFVFHKIIFKCLKIKPLNIGILRKYCSFHDRKCHLQQKGIHSRC